MRPYALGKCGSLCHLLAKKLGYTEKEVNEIAAGGLLHDIGKLMIEDRILRKPGKLDDLSFERFKTSDHGLHAGSYAQ